MSITGWRVHLTRRERPWPHEVTALMREFSNLFAELDQRLATLKTAKCCIPGHRLLF
ncbi:hypothetical protein [Streptomyces sp. NPDC057199]|uniref:hypothetical protein n=1 Tax=Streptomyces sp. NPDC057199 TaxID=3346047 RepID=UPI0036419B84